MKSRTAKGSSWYKEYSSKRRNSKTAGYLNQHGTQLNGSPNRLWNLIGQETYNGMLQEIELVWDMLFGPLNCIFAAI